MQQNKNTKSLSEINSYCQNTSVMVGIFNQLLGKIDLRYINKLFSGVKKRGVDGSKIIQTIMSGFRQLRSHPIRRIISDII